MVNIAIAGGNGLIGRTIKEVLQEQDKHKVFTLTRQDPDASDQRTLKVDYQDVEAVKTALEQNDIHTVICAFTMEGDALQTSHLSLIEAASKSSTTKRFVPTSFAIAYPKEAVALLPTLEYYFQALDRLEASELEYTVIVNGMFLDYFGMPHIKTHLTPLVMVLDIENRAAAIPGSGDVPATFTYSYDAARFVAALLDQPRWSKESKIIGDTVTWNEFLRTAEEVTGEKFDVTYDSIEKLKRFKITELPGHGKLYDKYPKKALQWFLAAFELMTTDETSYVSRDGALNGVFPEIQPLTVREMVTKCWGK
ncbi:hypothetical protein M409DRAFT_26015 [Zasmidium cellare ATCC 36951]|uniref:NmrA-like domain-containing protein n=1 Tax=Zasmidium cellare ATCC 36951 TaxID=1080233 RepID=A0A6A6C9Y1_ZASCE|nr:uncharacterized protein M409DRAFT_26015 [Zasmidium cellare ATCC 36951]KAF2163835.1 hypothetical protein M409DRAFT_26015 [Zasmidium cellare ATCC 36951]